ncbi:MAG TPA: hypothetical protein VEX86_24790 [Longimicrobium sp.]|nr:hypothetical protein [Longimicrobium sp.]
MSPTVFVCRVRVPEGTREYVTVLPPDDVLARGLPNHAIVGALLHPLAEGEDAHPDVFTPNPAFVRFMHDVLARHAASEPGLRDEARRLGDGYVYVIDARTPDPTGAVPPEDVIGAVQVTGGEPVPGSYRANPKHQLLTAHGFFSLGEELHALLMREVEELRTGG